MQDAQDAVQQLAALLSNLLPASRVALEQAVAVAAIDGVGGTLVVKVPPKPTAPLELSFTTGRAKLTLE